MTSRLPHVPGAHRIEFAHILRAVAAGSVVFGHLAYTFWLSPQIVAGLVALPSLERLSQSTGGFVAPDFGVPSLWGFFGVGLFFLISGFVIPFSVAKLSRSGFLAARIFRIWPTYIAGLSIALLCIAANAAYSGIAFPYSLGEILAHYFVLPRWPTLTRPIDGILWTLEIEVFFYALCAALLYRLRHGDIAIFAFGLAPIPAALMIVSATPFLLSLHFAVYAIAHWISSMLLFVCFMLIGTAFYFHHRGRIGIRGLVVLECGLLASFTTAWWLGPFSAQGWSGPISFVLANLVFALAYVAPETIAKPAAPVRRSLGWLADISYPLYAIHGILGYSLLAHLLAAGAPAWMALPATVGLVIGLAAMLHVIVERPSRALGRDLAARLSNHALLNSPK